MNLLKKITIVLILVGVWQPADAQLLKKIGERAGKAAERTILNKTDQKVSQKIGKGIDDVVDGKPKTGEKTTEHGEQISGEDGNIPVPRDTYFFTHLYKMKMSGMEEKVEPITVNYLLAANASYTGIRMEQQGTAIVTVMDQLSRTIHTFMDVNGNKLSNSVVMPNALQEKESDGATGLLNSRITGLPDKTIVGHHCKGKRIEDGDNDIILYYTETKGMNLSLFDVENNG